MAPAKTFAEIAEKRGDIALSKSTRKQTLTISGAGLQGSGKTAWALNSMPTPMLHVNFDRPSEHLRYSMPKGRAQDIVPIEIGPEMFGDSLEWTELTANQAIEKMLRAFQDYLPALSGGTVVLDGGGMLNQLVQLKELAAIKRTREAKDQKLFPFDYAPINAWFTGVLSRLNRAETHFYLTHQLSEKWGSDGPLGTYYAQSNSSVPKVIEVEMWFWCLCAQITNLDKLLKTKKGETVPAKVLCKKHECTAAGHTGRMFTTRIMQNKLNKKAEGLTKDDTEDSPYDFGWLYRTTFGREYGEEVKEEGEDAS